MSLLSATVQPQNTTHFHWTQEIWNQAWHSDDGFSMKSLCAKVACIVFPIILSVALVEGILWAGRSIFKISSDPKTDPLAPSCVKKASQDSSNKKTEQEAGVNNNEQQQEPNPIVDRVHSNEQLGINPPIKGANVDDHAVKNLNIITVALNTGSSQHDIVVNHYDPKDQRPPACAFHALKAIYFISTGFEGWEKRIEDRNFEELSLQQRDIIQSGAMDYFDALEMDPTFKEDVDLERIKKYDPTFLDDRNLFLDQTHQAPRQVAEQTQAIVEHLFKEQEEPDAYAARGIAQIAFLKNGKGESIGVVCAANKAIVFNSHNNAITMTIGKEGTQEYLTEIMNLNPFSYALGQYNLHTKPAREGQQVGTNSTIKIADVGDNAVKNPNIITVPLNAGSSQHDIEGNYNDPENQRPPACAFHALNAIYYTSSSIAFNFIAKHIGDRNIKELSEHQRQMIHFGTKSFFNALTIDPCFKESADLVNIKLKVPEFLLYKHLYLQQTNHDPKPVAERTQVIVEHLFLEHEKPADIFAHREIFQIAFLKNGNGQSIGLVCAANKTIFFNSHVNAITMTIAREATQAYLTEILAPFAKMEYGVDQNPFSYALGQYNPIKNNL